jgi:hypothetical protein
MDTSAGMTVKALLHHQRTVTPESTAVKPQALFQELKDLAERLGITVSEQNFRPTGIRVKSGYCKVKNQDHCIIDKHVKLSKKMDVLGECISRYDHESIYVIPAVRDYLNRFTHASQSIPDDRSVSSNSETN